MNTANSNFHDKPKPASFHETSGATMSDASDAAQGSSSGEASKPSHNPVQVHDEFASEQQSNSSMLSAGNINVNGNSDPDV